ncbi:MAG: hypothetical protein H0V12_10940 [Chloroflexi bacterium]|nr:hypothetical protein [Chloroflexota bacterium]
MEGSRTTLVAPSDTSAVAAPVFSPNGDGSADMLRVGYRLHLGLDTLDLVVRIPDGTALGSLSLPGRTHGDHVFDWDGRLNGLNVPDGVVVLQVTGVRDGTTYSVPDEDSSVDSVADALSAVVDTLAPSLDGPHLDRSALSPNGESLEITGQVGADALGWSLEVERPAVVVRSFVGAAPSVAVAWDGRDAAGAPVPDGTYTVRLRTVDQAGNAAEQSAIVAVDGTAPVAGLTTTIAGFVTGSTPGSFSPDGDRVSDVASIAWTASERSAAVLEISGPEGTGGVVRTVGFSPRTGGSFTWNGRDGSNASVADGVYTLALRTTDGPGNASFTTGSLVVDRTLGFVTASPVVWHPSDGDRLASTSTFRFRLSASATTWLRVRSASGTVVRTAWIRQARASGQHAWRWDGRDRYGALVPDGRYTLEVVAMRSGVKRIARLTTTLGGFEINLSSTTPSVGQRLSVLARSAEPLSAAPIIVFAQSGRPVAKAVAVRQPDGRYAVTFAVAAGGVGPATITVRGTDTGGGRNRSTTTVAVREA